jgi:hypothetical protein
MVNKREAESLLEWGFGQNPGPWAEHCRNAARTAETIAQKCGMDAQRAFISGLLHDIGYYAYRDGKGKSCHIYLGYELLADKGHPDIARICLTHSFPYKDAKAYGGADFTVLSDGEMAFIASFIRDIEYDDYDRLIQLCDCLCTAQGVTLLERRMVDVAMRHGFNPYTLKRWEEYYKLKDYFDDKCGINVYNLFYDEIKGIIF